MSRKLWSIVVPHREQEAVVEDIGAVLNRGAWKAESCVALE